MLRSIPRAITCLLWLSGVAAAAGPYSGAIPARSNEPLPAGPAPSATPSPANSPTPSSPYSYGESYWSMASPAASPAEFSLTPGYPRNVGGVAPGSLHERHPYYSYRRPWYTPGPASLNVTIVW